MTPNTIQQKTYDLGNKIRNFRLRAGLSQFKLEELIDASPGSISRIENGEVNPTKETLSKISKKLKLTPKELGSLLDLDIITFEDVVTSIHFFSDSLDLDMTLQAAVDVMFGLLPNYNGGVLLLEDNQHSNRFYSKTVSNMPKIEMVHNLLGKKLSEFYIDIDKTNQNLIAKAINRNESFQSNNLFDFGRGMIKESIVRLIVKTLNFKSGIVIPLKYKNEIIGATIYTKNIDEGFSEYEQKILGLLNMQIAIAIMNARKYEALRNNANINL